MNNFLFRPNQNIEILGAKTKVVLVLGALGSGKTHFINSLFPYTPEKTTILVNDVGSINIDAKRLKNPNIITLSEGCVCCEDIAGMKRELINAKNSEMIIIEPTGIAGGDDILSLVKSLGFDVRVITLQDVQHFGNTKPDISKTPEENKIREAQMEILKNQIQVADIIGYTKMNENFSEVQEWVQSINKNAQSYLIPQESGENMGENAQILEIFQKLQKSTKKQVGLILSIKKEKSPTHQNPLKTYSFVHEIQSLNFEGLKNYLANHPQVIRAKGVIENISFNYTHGSLDIEGYSPEVNCANFISETTLDIPKNFSSSAVEITQRNYEIIPESDFQEKIDTLVAQYEQRMNLDGQIKLLEKDIETNAQMIQALQLKQKTLGESMKYDNPHIWLEYKIEAYKNTSGKIDTIAELKKHAESPTYICHKRLHFLNNYTKEKFGKDLFDETLDQNMLVRDFYAGDDIKASLDEDIMKSWLQYEYFEIQGKVSKWENYN